MPDLPEGAVLRRACGCVFKGYDDWGTWIPGVEARIENDVLEIFCLDCGRVCVEHILDDKGSKQTAFNFGRDAHDNVG